MWHLYICSCSRLLQVFCANSFFFHSERLPLIFFFNSWNHHMLNHKFSMLGMSFCLLSFVYLQLSMKPWTIYQVLVFPWWKTFHYWFDHIACYWFFQVFLLFKLTIIVSNDVSLCIWYHLQYLWFISDFIWTLYIYLKS